MVSVGICVVCSCDQIKYSCGISQSNNFNVSNVCLSPNALYTIQIIVLAICSYCDLCQCSLLCSQLVLFIVLFIVLPVSFLVLIEDPNDAFPLHFIMGNIVLFVCC